MDDVSKNTRNTKWKNEENWKTLIIEIGDVANYLIKTGIASDAVYTE